MSCIVLETQIQAGCERVFDLSRSVDVHVQSADGTRERAVAGVTSGLLELGDEVTWRARHFGISQTLAVRITQFDRPHHFRDSMVRGAFRRMDHDHDFEPRGSGCLMRDRFDFTAPLGILGALADALVLHAHFERFLRARNEVIRRLAEATS